MAAALLRLSSLPAAVGLIDGSISPAAGMKRGRGVRPRRNPSAGKNTSRHRQRKENRKQPVLNPAPSGSALARQPPSISDGAAGSKQPVSRLLISIQLH